MCLIISFAQLMKFYEMMNAFSNNNNNNYSPLISNPPNQNMLLLAQLNNMINQNPPQRQIQEPQQLVDTNDLLKKLMSQLQTNQPESSSNQNIVLPFQPKRLNLRKKEYISIYIENL